MNVEAWRAVVQEFSVDLGWFGALLVGMLVAMSMVRSWLPEKPTREGNDSRNVVAYEIVGGVPVVYMAFLGCRAAWDGSMTAMAGSQHSRLYGYDSSFMDLARVTFAYEVWNAVVCTALVAQFRTVPFVGHHIFTATLAWIVRAPYLHYYGFFFLGISSCTSALLAPVDIFRYRPDLAEQWPRLNLVLRNTFAVAFMIVRVALWVWLSSQFWLDSVRLLIWGKPHSAVAVVFVLVANIFLTSLQLLWAKKVVRSLIKQMSGKKK